MYLPSDMDAPVSVDLKTPSKTPMTPTASQASPMAAVKMAVTGLHARYTAVEGREPKLIGGRASKGSSDKFESTAQLVEAMSDPRYSKDPAYQRKVQEKLGRSSIF